VKEIVLRKTGQKLKLEQKEDGKYYSCPIDGQLLIALYKSNDWGLMSSCPHFQWEEMSISCFIGIGDECDPKEIMQLRRQSMIQIFDGIWVNLLVQKQS